MMLTGYDSPPLHTLYLDRPLKGALLMQTLARVNRTFRGKTEAFSWRTRRSPRTCSRRSPSTPDATRRQADGPDVDEAEGADRAGGRRDPRCWPATTGGRRHTETGRLSRRPSGTTNYLRNPATPGNQAAEGDETLRRRYRSRRGQLARAWALCSGPRRLAELRPEVQFYEEVRVWMAKFDAEERRARAGRAGGGPAVARRRHRRLDRVRRGTRHLRGGRAAQAESLRPDPDFAAQAQQASNPHLAIEALRQAGATSRPGHPAATWYGSERSPSGSPS